MSQLFQLVYVSSASELMSEADLKNLLIAARTRNELRGITGLLLYKQGNIIQAIEGEEAAVRTLMSRIKADSRHRGIIVLYTDYIESRYFPDWAMAYENISNEEIEGYSDFLSLNGSNSEKVIEAGAAKKLLSGFRKKDNLDTQYAAHANGKNVKNLEAVTSLESGLLSRNEACPVA